MVVSIACISVSQDPRFHYRTKHSGRAHRSREVVAISTGAQERGEIKVREPGIYGDNQHWKCHLHLLSLPVHCVLSSRWGNGTVWDGDVWISAGPFEHDKRLSHPYHGVSDYPSHPSGSKLTLVVPGSFDIIPTARSSGAYCPAPDT